MLLHLRRPLRPLYRLLSSAAAAADADVSAARATARLRSLFDRHGESDYIGEPISVTQHSIQAAMAARAAGEEIDVVVGALLHDVGHLLGLEAGYEPAMDGCGTVDHEGIGHDFLLGLGLPQRVAYLTKHHVNAKRYLCLREEGYYESLSKASQITLEHQGGVMSEEEALEMEKSKEDLEAVLRFRTYDEAAKDPNALHPSLDAFMQSIHKLIIETISEESKKSSTNEKQGGLSPFANTYVLSSEQLRRWDQDGMLWIKNALTPTEIESLDTLANEAGNLPKGEGPWLIHHEEVGDGEKRLCRVENFCKNHAAWGNLCFGLVQDLVSQVEREEAVLFKDKLNYKGPGGGGFLVHQDATAYATEDLAKRHVSVMVAIDPATVENGSLQVAAGRHNEGIFPHEKGVITKEVENSMDFENILVEPGDIVLFDSYLPHRSDPNLTDSWRRLAYLTFNKLKEGDLHGEYYRKKQEVMQKGAISINLDFGGKIVD